MADRPHEVHYTAKAVRARKAHPCDSWHGGPCQIEAGAIYVRAVAFGQHDAHGGGRGARPWVMRHCAVCAGHWTSTAGLVEAYEHG